MPAIVLRAFNAELAQIPDNVKQESLVQIRMQWWRDAVKSAYSDRPEPNPIILAMREVLQPPPNMLQSILPGLITHILAHPAFFPIESYLTCLGG